MRAIGELLTGEEGSFSTYGYVVDLALRLNTANAEGAAGNLLLQTEAAQRIYDSSENAETLGGGSYMSFNIGATGLDIDDLMSAARVTFVQNLGNAAEGVTPTILGTAALDTTEKSGADADGSISAPLYLLDTNKTLLNKEGDVQELMELVKNQATQISAVVWLDGYAMKNASVSAIDTDKVQITLNLQFATDVELEPAMNTVLHGEAADEPATPSTSPSVEEGT